MKAMIAMMMEAVGTSETSVNLYETTWRNIPEGYHLHTVCRETMKSHVVIQIDAYHECITFMCI
jgi:hypothetical protein